MHRLHGHKLLELRSLMARKIRIGTRGSKLALWQTQWVLNALQALHPAIAFELITIKTKGDKITDVPLAQVGGSALFVKELEQALTDRRIDIAVHSMKDMPSAIPEGLIIGAVPEREIPLDVLISKHNTPFLQLAPGAAIGTSSLRRQSQLLHARGDIKIVPIRGNLDTRIQKLHSEPLDAIVVAAAGVKRLNLQDNITEYLDDALMLPAVGQGALCIEIRADDHQVASLVAPLDHAPTRTVVLAERAFLRKLGGSCQVPMAAYGKLNQAQLTLHGMVADINGTRVLRNTITGSAEQPEALGNKLSEIFLGAGADDILERIMKERQ